MAMPVTGLYEVLNSFGLLRTFYDAIPEKPPFLVEIVSAEGATTAGSGLPLSVHRSINEIDRTDIAIVPSMALDGYEDGYEWTTGRHPAFVDWLVRMHEGGAMLCSACSGALVLAETGLLDGRKATIHWAFAPTFRRNFPKVDLCLDKILVVAGDRGEFVMSGAAGSWHDLMLYLIAHHVGPIAAQAMAKFMVLDWHSEGQAPYVTFTASTNHNDAVIRKLQIWLDDHFTVASPVEEMARLSGLSTRSFERRFKKATGYSPIAYVQRLRVEDAKRRLEQTDASIEDISWAVGYEDPAFFRRLFQRITGLSPSAYRRKFSMPTFVQSPVRSITATAGLVGAAKSNAARSVLQRG